MSKLLSISVDVTKIPRNKIVEGRKGKYIDLDIWINDEPDQYGNDASASVRQSKEEREAKDRKTYVGNGKKVFGWEDGDPRSPMQQQSTGTYAETGDMGEVDDIPF